MSKPAESEDVACPAEQKPVSGRALPGTAVASGEPSRDESNDAATTSAVRVTATERQNRPSLHPVRTCQAAASMTSSVSDPSVVSSGQSNAAANTSASKAVIIRPLAAAASASAGKEYVVRSLCVGWYKIEAQCTFVLHAKK